MRVIVWLVSLLMLQACSDDGPRPEPLVVYTTAHLALQLQPQFDDFTADSGVPVSLHFGPSGLNAQSVIDNRGAPPADILITDNIADIWHAGDQGALRPILSDALSAWPGQHKDPEGLWIALNSRSARIAVADAAEVESPADLAALAEPKYRGALCLSTSSLPVNRSLIAAMIESLGARPAELLVRGWVQNLAVPPYASDALVHEALLAGTCRYAIVAESTTSGAAHFDAEIDKHHADAVGIARHARYPESAQLFVDWLLLNVSNEMQASDRYMPDASTIGWRDIEAQELAERARYR